MASQSEIDAQNAKAYKFFDEAAPAALAEIVAELQGITTDLAGQGIKRAPVKDGFLRASINDDPVQIDAAGPGRLIRGSVSARTPYAFIQHEREDFRHPRGGEDHYISKPLEEKKKDYWERLSRAIQRAFKKAKGAS